MRKGFLSALALLAGDAALEAQYYPVPQAYSPPAVYPQPVQMPPQMYPQMQPGYYAPRPPMPVYHPMQYARPQAYYPNQPIPSYNPYAQSPYRQPIPNSAYANPSVQAQPTAQEIVVQPNGPEVNETAVPPAPPALATITDGEVESPTVAEAPVQAVSFRRPREDCFWVGADFTMAWMRPDRRNLPLVTTGSPNDFNLGEIPAALGSPSTRVLLSTDEVANDTFYGFRAEAGYWLDNDRRFSLDVAGFYLLPQTQEYALQSDGAGNPLIARPVLDVVNNTETVFVDSFPGSVDPVVGPIPPFSSGGINVKSSSHMFGAEVNGRYHAYAGQRVHSELIFGFRAVQLEEDLEIRENSTALIDNFLTFLGAPLLTGDSIGTRDYFQTSNTFYGFQVGGRLRYQGDWFYLDAFAKGAFGVTDQRVYIDGSSSVTRAAGGTQTAVGGVLAGTTNVGDYQRHRFSVLPEFGFNLGVEVTRHIRVKSGYSILMWNNVTRPSQIIDRSINPNFIPTDPAFGAVAGPARPAFNFNDQLFWVSNFNFGFEFHY